MPAFTANLWPLYSRVTVGGRVGYVDTWEGLKPEAGADVIHYVIFEDGTRVEARASELSDPA